MHYQNRGQKIIICKLHNSKWKYSYLLPSSLSILTNKLEFMTITKCVIFQSFRNKLKINNYKIYKIFKYTSKIFVKTF